MILRIVGLDPAKVLARGVRVELPGSTTFLVMHLFNLLRSRLANLHELREKQNDEGAAQLRLAIDVARAPYLQEQAARYPPAETGARRVRSRRACQRSRRWRRSTMRGGRLRSAGAFMWRMRSIRR